MYNGNDKDNHAATNWMKKLEKMDEKVGKNGCCSSFAEYSQGRPL